LITSKRRKALWYYARDFFAPVLPSLRLEGDKIIQAEHILIEK
jgi:hypothetical protein